MYRLNHSIRFFILLIIVFGFNNIASAGMFEIRQSLEAGWQHDSNFYKSETLERAVRTYHVKPGIEFGYTAPKSSLSAKYSLDRQWYDDEDEVLAGQFESDEYDYTGHLGELAAESKLTDHLFFSLNGMYAVTRDPGSSDLFNNAVERLRYSITRLNPRIVYQFGNRAGMGFGYTGLNTDYSKMLKEDSDENRGTADLFFLITQRTSLTLNCQYWKRNYSVLTPDYVSKQGMLMLSRAGKYFQFSAGAGFHERSFEEQAAVLDIDSPVWMISLTGQNPPEARERPKSSMILSVNQNFNDAGEGHTYFLATKVMAGATWMLQDRLNLRFNGSYQNCDYEIGDRKDQSYSASAGIDYYISDYVTFGLEGGYAKRDSSDPGKDYDSNYGMINLKFHYNLGSK